MIYFFYGDEEFNISNEIKKFKSKLDKNFIEMSYKYFNNPKFPDLIAAVRTQPMMFGKMLLEINCLSYLSGKSEDKAFDDNQIKQITEALDNVSENLDIIFVAQLEPDSQKKIDKRRKLFKTLSKYNAKEFAQIPSYKTAELEAWIKQQAKTKDLKLNDEIASTILLQVGSNLRMIDSELEKLKIFAGNNAVTKEMVKEICVTNEDLFIFADYLITENKSKALAEYQKLLSKKHPLEILSVLHTLLHGKIQIKANSSKYSADEIAKIINMHPYRVKLELQKLKNVSLKNLVKLKQNLTNAEYKIKSGQASLDIDKEIEYAILQ
ncbi:DNA polymerase III subunit delta [bacterium]|nr:DNA polymerase III subunit delta [bacterium]